MIKAATEPRESGTYQCPGIIGRERQSDESQSVDPQSEREKFFSAQAVRQCSEGVTWEKIGNPQHGDQQRRLFDAAQFQILLDTKVQRQQCDLVKMSEGMEGTDQPERAVFVRLVV